MVVKPTSLTTPHSRAFEYGVILNGSQTSEAQVQSVIKFEYGVILNGSQTQFVELVIVN